jgi:hypothetical protein
MRVPSCQTWEQLQQKQWRDMRRAFPPPPFRPPSPKAPSQSTSTSTPASSKVSIKPIASKLHLWTTSRTHQTSTSTLYPKDAPNTETSHRPRQVSETLHPLAASPAPVVLGGIVPLSTADQQAQTAVLDVVERYVRPKDNQLLPSNFVESIQHHLAAGGQLLARGVGLHVGGFNDASEMLHRMWTVLPQLEELFVVNHRESLVCDVGTYRGRYELSKPQRIPLILLTEENISAAGDLPHLNQLERMTETETNSLGEYAGCNVEYVKPSTQKEIAFNDMYTKASGITVYKQESYQAVVTGRYLAMQIKTIMGITAGGHGTRVRHDVVNRLRTVSEYVEIPSHMVGSDPVRFRLMGIVYVVYDMGTHVSGHYVAHGRRAGDKWWFFDDGKSSCVSSKEDVLHFNTREFVSSPTAPTLLFYARDIAGSGNVLPAVGLANPGAACYLSALLQGLMPALAHLV